MTENVDIYEDIENNFFTRSHQPAGPIYKNFCKQHAYMCFRKEENLKGIFSLSESHAPTYRIKTTYRYDKILKSSVNQPITMNKEHISFNCPLSFEEGINIMLGKIEELPKEWTIIQITTRFNLKENMAMNISEIYTDPLYISVFNCGQSTLKPFCINVKAPQDINGAPIELCREMRSIIDENKHLLFNCFGAVDLKTITAKQKKIYAEKKAALNIRLKDVLKQIETNWLGIWRCLFIGKFVNDRKANEIYKKIDELFVESNNELSEETRYLLQKIVASSELLRGNEILKAVNHCIPNNKELRSKLYKQIMHISTSFKFKKLKRYPVILIIDEKLDCFPWEMMDVLADHPVSRSPSLHFVYALYKEHKTTIKNGFKEVSANGSYIINPGLDLKKMEVRLKNFFNYWLPKWGGIAGQTPTSDEFSNYLTNGDIFIYNGHGSGTQFLSGSKIQQMRVNSVVLLFGCSSVRMSPMGPFVEMYDVFHNYLIACSPCVVGMIWEVTDFDTDILSTSLLSHWIPSKAKTHWKLIDKVKWEKGNIIPLVVTNQRRKLPIIEHEPELLRAINIAKGEPVQFLTKCAIVARGLPIKIVSK